MEYINLQKLTYGGSYDDDDEFVFAREVQFPHGAYKEKEKTKRKGTKETITKGHTPRKKSTVHA